MKSANQERTGIAQRLDTSYTSFRSKDGIRSPRTPTYIPDSPSSGLLTPFDHAKFLDKSELKPLNSPPPQTPETWVWTCHLCHSRYPLGVTRRCLVDGHYYCSGETDRPSLRKRKKPKSCSSEFDYHSWKAYGEWRRKVLRAMENPRILRGCDYCDYPSQCLSGQAHPIAGIVSIHESKSDTASSTAVGVRDSNSPNSPKDAVLNDILSNHKQGTDDSKGCSRRAKEATTVSMKHRKEVQGVLIPSLQEEMDKEVARLQEIVGMHVWSDMGAVELEKE
ncbi:hypothetical protein A1O1_08272, partial [Capronia coronata CBS 617.96]